MNSYSILYYKPPLPLLWKRRGHAGCIQLKKVMYDINRHIIYMLCGVRTASPPFPKEGQGWFV